MRFEQPVTYVSSCPPMIKKKCGNRTFIKSDPKDQLSKLVKGMKHYHHPYQKLRYIRYWIRNLRLAFRFDYHFINISCQFRGG